MTKILPHGFVLGVAGVGSSNPLTLFSTFPQEVLEPPSIVFTTLYVSENLDHVLESHN